ncbi:MAG: HEPN domain-containing protein [Candidatus Odinarchaeota archaeon]|nr:HEPN domain-containing protein [Candidatus Odinarchaeota archaeon]
MVRKLNDYEDCISRGLLRRVPPSKEKANKSIETAEDWLNEARKSLMADAFNSSLICSYLSMFHSARSILFYDGYREKSHYCIARYLEEKYVKNGILEIKWIELLDHYRDLRHASQYGVESFTIREEAENAIEIAEKFLDRMRRLLKEKEDPSKNL